MTVRVLKKRVEVKWRDSHHRGYWGEMADHKKTCSVGPIESIGYLLTINKDVVQLAQSESLSLDQIAGVTTIPRENVVWIRKLKPGKKIKQKN